MKTGERILVAVAVAFLAVQMFDLATTGGMTPNQALVMVRWFVVASVPLGSLAVLLATLIYWTARILF